MIICPNCYAIMPQIVGGEWRGKSEDGKGFFVHTCGDETEHRGIDYTLERYSEEVRNQVYSAKEYLADLTAIWDKTHPGHEDEWEYRGQIVRDAIQFYRERAIFENFLADLIAAGTIERDTLPEEVKFALLMGEHAGRLGFVGWSRDNGVQTTAPDERKRA